MCYLPAEEVWPLCHESASRPKISHHAMRHGLSTTIDESDRANEPHTLCNTVIRDDRNYLWPGIARPRNDLISHKLVFTTGISRHSIWVWIKTYLISTLQYSTRTRSGRCNKDKVQHTALLSTTHHTIRTAARQCILIRQIKPQSDLSWIRAKMAGR